MGTHTVRGTPRTPPGPTSSLVAFKLFFFFFKALVKEKDSNGEDKKAPKKKKVEKRAGEYRAGQVVDFISV